MSKLFSWIIWIYKNENESLQDTIERKLALDPKKIIKLEWGQTLPPFQGLNDLSSIELTSRHINKLYPTRFLVLEMRHYFGPIPWGQCKECAGKVTCHLCLIEREYGLHLCHYLAKGIK